MGAAIPVEVETRVVAYMARGDTYPAIREQIPEHPLTDATFLQIKKRNKENIDLLKKNIQAKTLDETLNIKQKANTKISKRLDLDDKNLEILEKLNEDYLNGEIDAKEFVKLSNRVRSLSVTELVSVSKEMHNQTKDTEAPAVAPKDMAEIIAAIKNGDEVELQRIVFNGKSDTPTTPN